MGSLNHALFLWLNLGTGAPTWAVALARAASQSLPGYLVAATVAVAFVGKPAWCVQAWRALVAIVVAALLANLLKHWIGAPRPVAFGLGVQWLPHGRSGSFPSAHATLVAAWTVAAVFVPTRNWIRALFVAIALLVSWSRIALGLHFPLDVVAGWALGAACALGVEVAARRTQFGRLPSP